LNKDDVETEYANELYLAEVFGSIISSGNNKNIICLVEAKPGQGKSWAAMRLACDCAVYLSEHLGGVPTDYFTIDNMGIIMPDKMVECIENMKKYQVTILDDVGMAYAGRKWQSKGNEAMNNMLQTMRTDNNIIIMTVPDSDWIDKIGRNILHFKLVMETPLHSMGYSMGRITAVQKLYNATSRKNIFPYLKLPDKIYNKVVFSRPDEVLTVEYESRRAIQLGRLKQESIDLLKSNVNELSNTDIQKMSKAQTDLDKAFAIHEMKETEGIAIRKGCEMLNLKKDKYYQLKKDNRSMFVVSVGM